MIAATGGRDGRIQSLHRALEKFYCAGGQGCGQIPLANHARKGIEATEKGFGQRKGHQHDSIAETDLSVSKALHVVKSGKHDPNAEKGGKRGQKLPEQREEKGGFVLHLTLEVDAEIAPI